MERSFALFDFDGTLRKGDSIVEFLLYARRKKLCSLPRFLLAAGAGVLYGLHLLSAKKSKEAALRFLAGRSEKEIDRIGREFAKSCLKPGIYREGFEILQRSAREGKTVWIVTASPDFYMKPMGQMLGADCVVATRLLYSEGRYTGLLSENCVAAQKPIEIARELSERGDRLSYADSIAYGDSRSDRYMMALCEENRWINPKRKLEKQLKPDEKTRILYWGRSVKSA